MITKLRRLQSGRFNWLGMSSGLKSASTTAALILLVRAVVRSYLVLRKEDKRWVRHNQMKSIPSKPVYVAKEQKRM